MGKWVVVLCILGVLLVQGCAPDPSPGLGDPVGWDDLQGWENDNHLRAWSAFLESCEKLSSAAWTRVCDLARSANPKDAAEARGFFEQHLQPHPMFKDDGSRTGLVTGYYEPLLNGSFTPDDRYQYPLYGVPSDLLVIDLTAIYPELGGKRLRGKLVGNKVVPYHDRATLDTRGELLEGSEILWVDNLVDLFFLHIQGSGRVRLPTGSMVAVGYADQNGHPYRSIGKVLVDMKEMNLEEVNLFSLKQWLYENPVRLRETLYENPSYVFFKIKETTADGPVGALNVPLTPERSVAVDRSHIQLGAPIWLQTSLPDESNTPFNRLMLAQDTGGAIRGHVRVDVFWGRGTRAEKMAGLMKQDGEVFVLQPKTR